jgi:exodeoxyribonuclease VII large subunit
MAHEPKNESPKDKIFSVSELNTLAGSVLQKNVGEVWVRGEVSGLKAQPSGHIYFSLKDAGSVLSVALFKNVALRNSTKLLEGKQILIFGEVDIYLPRGSYQMIARFVLDEGAGKLQQEFERLKRQLEAEGLFSPENKIPLPRLPQSIAFVTSPTGAVWQDFTRILLRQRWGGRVINFPCRVQGAEAPDEIVASLKNADARSDIDLVVVGRGGGSLEDLWAFNDERVVRAVAAMKKPVISAVGHQTDFTLTDFAADFRAETPSAAAELIAGFMNDARAQAEYLSTRLKRAMISRVNFISQVIDGFASRLHSRAPKVLMQRAWQRLDELGSDLRRSIKIRIESEKEVLATLQAKVSGLDPQRTLARGYVMVKRGESFVTTSQKTKIGEGLELEFYDGKKKIRVEN